MRPTHQLTGLLLIFSLYSHSGITTAAPQEIIVTATRTAQTVNEALASVTVITREDIQTSQALTVPEMLQSIAGLDLTRNGGLGKTTSVFMRGTESDHVLVLIDGIKISSATVGSVAFQHLPLHQIERIEIVRGPRSSLYGSEAIGGVIQIFTRKGQDKSHLEWSGGLGHDNTYQLTGGWLGSTKTGHYSVSVSYLQTDGFNACQGSTSGGCFTMEPDDDGYDNTAFNVKLGRRLGDNGQLEVYAWRAQGSTQYDSAFNNEADFVQQVIGLKADYATSANGLLNLNIGKYLDETDNFGHDSPATYFHTDRLMTSLQQTWLFSEKQALIVGYDYQQDEVDSSTAYTTDSRDNHGIFAEYQTPYGSADIIAGLRYDDNEQFGDYTTGNLGVGYGLGPKTRLIVSYGTAFKAPSFNELYFPNFGNAHLDPEESESFEVTLKNIQPQSHWSLSLYHTRIDKLIAAYFDATTGNLFADNLNQAKITGVDGALGWRQGGWEFNAQFAWLKPEDKTTGHLLPRRAEKTVHLEIAERRGPVRLSIGWLTQSHRYDDAANIHRLGGYSRIDLNGEYYLNKRWTLRLHLENLLDKEYQTARFYNTPDRTWLATLHYQQ